MFSFQGLHVNLKPAPHRPAVLIIHGTLDDVVPFSDGLKLLELTPHAQMVEVGILWDRLTVLTSVTTGSSTTKLRGDPSGRNLQPRSRHISVVSACQFLCSGSGYHLLGLLGYSLR
ncbi:hypothetical protein BDZ89DRAFT_642357 [Hymenopellis radicata]|nr:hypothetical protein BDZ89DRAFT_642357 [Hymenopellis radicata]